MSSSSLSSPLPLILSIFTAASLLWSHPALGQETLSWENIPFVAAQSFDAGYVAYRQKEYATALKHWQPLARQGNARVQVSLGTQN